MSPLTSRAPGLVGAALERPELVSGIIVDGHHVSPATLRIALACKAAQSLMLVTDAMPSVGSESESFILQGQQIFVREGACMNADGTLAGSNLDMASAVRNAVEMLGAPLETALEMASRTPAAFLRLEGTYGRVAPGYRADLVALDQEYRVANSWVGGSTVPYPARV